MASAETGAAADTDGVGSGGGFSFDALATGVSVCFGGLLEAVPAGSRLAGRDLSGGAGGVGVAMFPEEAGLITKPRSSVGRWLERLLPNQYAAPSAPKATTPAMAAQSFLPDALGIADGPAAAGTGPLPESDCNAKPRSRAD